MQFQSDNTAPVHPKLLESLVQVNHGRAHSYGDDSTTQSLQAQLSDIFDKQVSIFFTSTGTAANCLALKAISLEGGGILCTQDAHINQDEGFAPETLLPGRKIFTTHNPDSKLDLKQAGQFVSQAEKYFPHRAKIGCVSITQTNEWGVNYQLDELDKIREFADHYKLPVHMDGARFANALVSLKTTPAEMTWKKGVDVLSFGATKNGALCGEIVVCFNPKFEERLELFQKQLGQLVSKNRYFSAQIGAYLKDDLWLELARQANTQATRLKDIFQNYVEIELLYPVESNLIFARMKPELAKYLWAEGAKFYEITPGVYRFVTSFATEENELSQLASLLAKARSF